MTDVAALEQFEDTAGSSGDVVEGSAEVKECTLALIRGAFMITTCPECQSWPDAARWQSPWDCDATFDSTIQMRWGTRKESQ